MIGRNTDIFGMVNQMLKESVMNRMIPTSASSQAPKATMLMVAQLIIKVDELAEKLDQVLEQFSSEEEEEEEEEEEKQDPLLPKDKEEIAPPEDPFKEGEDG